MRTRIFVLCILLLNVFGVAAVASQQQRGAHAASFAPHTPWLVSVVHKINLVPTFKTNGLQASTIDGGNAYTFNLTTGIVIDHEGHVLTRLVNLNPNNASADIKVKTRDGRSLKAEVLGLDDSTGLTILKATDLNIEPPTFSADAMIDDGQMMRVLTPDFDLTVTAKANSETDKTSASKSSDPDSISFFPTMKVLTTAARLTRVEKGKTAHYLLSTPMRARKIADDSVVLNHRGQIVGLTMTTPSETTTVRPVTRATNAVYLISDARKLADKIITSKSTAKGWLGVSGISIAELSPDERNAFVSWTQLPRKGIVVSKVEPQSPAAVAGLMPNDVLIAFNHQEVLSSEQFSQILAATPIGEATEVQALRDGSTVKVQVKLAPRPVIVLKQVTTQGSALAIQIQDLTYRIAILQNELDSQQRRLATMPEGQQRLDAETKLKEIRELLEVQKSALTQIEGTTTTVNGVAAGQMRAVPTPTRPSYVALQLQLGLATQPLTDQLSSFFGVPMKMGILISTVRAGSVGDNAGLRAGDVLIELNGVSITNPATYQMAMSGLSTGRQIRAVVFRDKVRKEISFEIPNPPPGQNSPRPTERIVPLSSL